MKSYKTLSRFMAIILAAGLVLGNLWIAPPPAYAAPASALATQIAGIGSALTATVNALDPNVIDVSGIASVNSTVNLNIDRNVTVNWRAALTGSTASGKYMLNLSGGGTFNLVGGATLSNNSGLITVTGEGANLLIADATLTTPSAGNGLSVNVAAGDVTVTIGAKGSIMNEGTNSAVNVTAGVRGVRINVSSGTIQSTPAGYAINDGGTALCANDTQITINGGTVTSGSACAIKSTGADSAVVILDGTVTNAATVNSNPVIYMNGGLGENVIVGGSGEVIASDNNLGYGIQTTGGVRIMDDAQVIATTGRAVNLVGMDSWITVDGGLVTASSGIAICTATTNPASVANASITINGGIVSTTDESTPHGGRTIYATGENNTVTVNGGWVYTRAFDTEAIYITGTDSKAVVNGGWVSARNHFAIEAYSGGSVYINGGFVFAYGDEPLIPKTGAKIYSSAVGAISESRIILNGFDAVGNPVIDEYTNDSGNGVVVAWDREEWMASPWDEDDYDEGTAEHLTVAPSDIKLGISSLSLLSGFSLPDFLSGDDSLDSMEDEDIENLSDDPDPSAFVEDTEPSGLAGDDTSLDFMGIQGLSDFSEETEQPFILDEETPEVDEEDDDGDPALSADGDTTASIDDNDEKPDAEAEEDSSEIEEGDGAPAPEGLMKALALTPFAETGSIYWHSNGGRPKDGIYYNNNGNVGFFPLNDVGGSSDAVNVMPIPTYELIVIGGTGTGYYEAGVTIGLTADVPGADKVFDYWRDVTGVSGDVSFADAFSPVTSFVMPNHNVTVEAVFRDKLYSLTVVDGTGGGSYRAGQLVSISAAAPPAGREFDQWTDGFSGGPRGSFYNAYAPTTTFQMPAASATVTAEYRDIPLYAFKLTGGSVISSSVPATGGKYPAGTVIKINGYSAFIANYLFTGWYVKTGGGSFIGDDALSQFNAQFIMPAADTEIELNALIYTGGYAQNLTVIHGDDITANGPYSAGVDVLVMAEDAPPGKVFSGWTVASGRGIFADAGAMSTKFRMSDKETTIVANYEDIRYGLFVEYGAIAGGTFAGEKSGKFVTGEEISLTAVSPDVPVNGAMRYNFAGWTVAGGGTFAEPGERETTFTMPDNAVVVTAHWTPEYRIVVLDGEIVNFDPVFNAHVSYFGAGALVEIDATGYTPPTDYMFGGWYSRDGGSFDNATLLATTFIMPDNDVYITTDKVYSPGGTPTLYELTVVDGTGGGDYAAGDLVSILASATKGGLDFTRWTSYSSEGTLNAAGKPNLNFGSFIDPLNYSTSFIMPDQDVTVTANYATIYHLDVIQGVIEGPSPTSSGDYLAGVRIPLVANSPVAGKVFSGWTAVDSSFANAMIMSTTFIMPAHNAEVTATYTDVERHNYLLTTINCSSDERGPFEEGSGVTVTVTADAPVGTVFDHWHFEGIDATDCTEMAGNPAQIKFTMPDKNVTVTAFFADVDIYQLTVVNGTGSGRYLPGDIAYLYASPAPAGRVFDRWSSQQIDLLDNPNVAVTHMFMPANDVTVTALYKDAPVTPRMPYTSSGSASSIVTPVAVGLRGDVSGLLNTKEHMAYVGGIGNYLFAPDKDMTRAETAQMFYNLLLDKNVKPSRTFSDVQEQAWYKTAVDTLASLGIIAGRTDGRFAPEDGITRAEFVSIAVRFTEETLGDKQAASFSDVPQYHWAYGSIITAESYGWIGGVGDGRFDPDRHISRAEVITMTNRMLLRVPDKAAIDSLTTLLLYTDVPKTHWAFYEIEEASNTHRFAKNEDGASETWTQDSER